MIIIIVTIRNEVTYSCHLEIQKLKCSSKLSNFVHLLFEKIPFFFKRCFFILEKKTFFFQDLFFFFSFFFQKCLFNELILLLKVV